MPWKSAEATCRNVKADLISFRRNDILTLLYKLGRSKRRKKRQTHYPDGEVAWTSAHATSLVGCE